MTGTDDDGRRQADERRKQRLAEQLRANLLKRKSQARARRDGEADQRPDGIDLAEPPARE